MKNKIYSLLALLSIFSIISCSEDSFTQVVTFDIPQEPNRLVATCEYLNGSDSIQVFISSSWNSGSESPSKTPLDKCKIELWDGTNKVVDIPYKLDQNVLGYDFSSGSNSIKTVQSYYAAQMPQKLADGKTYTLRVTCAGFETIEAKSTMPSPIPIKKTFFKKNGFKISGGFGGGSASFTLMTFDFDDPAGVQNLYNLQLVQNFTDTTKGGKKYLATHPFYTNQKFSADPFGNDDYHQDFTFTDEIFEGQSFSMRLGVDTNNPPIIYLGGNQYASSSFMVPGDYEVRLHSLSKEKVLFEQSSIKQSENEGNPFGEPIPLYTNFDKGFGLFALSAMSKGIIKFK